MAQAHCQAEIEARNLAIQAYLRACLLRDYAMKRMAEVGNSSSGDWWVVQFEQLSADADRLEPAQTAAQQKLDACLSKWGETATGPIEEPPPRNDHEFDECLKHRPDFTGDWL